MFEQSYKFSFEAAHHLGPMVDDPAHPYAQLHGHSFEVCVTLQSETLSKNGWIVDFDELRRASDEIKSKLDHKLLNDIPGLDVPTLERIADWVFKEMLEKFDSTHRIDIRRPTLGEHVARIRS